MATFVTTKLQKAEIESLLHREREKSGLRPAVSDADIARFESQDRSQRETLPAPPEPPEEDVDGAAASADPKP